MRGKGKGSFFRTSTVSPHFIHPPSSSHNSLYSLRVIAFCYKVLLFNFPIGALSQGSCRWKKASTLPASFYSVLLPFVPFHTLTPSKLRSSSFPLIFCGKVLLITRVHLLFTAGDDPWSHRLLVYGIWHGELGFIFCLTLLIWGFLKSISQHRIIPLQPFLFSCLTNM